MITQSTVSGLHTRSALYFSARSLLGTMVQDIINVGKAKSQLKLLMSPRVHHRCKHDSINIVWSILLRSSDVSQDTFSSLRCLAGQGVPYSDLWLIESEQPCKVKENNNVL